MTMDDLVLRVFKSLFVAYNKIEEDDMFSPRWGSQQLRWTN